MADSFRDRGEATPGAVALPPAVAAAPALRVGWRAEPAGWAVSNRLPAFLESGLPSAATAEFCTRTLELRAPFGFRCRVRCNGNGAGIEWINNPTGRPPWEIFSMTPKAQWSAPDRPSIQWLVNSLLVSDLPAFAETLAPFLSPSMRGWPGTLVPGVLDIQRWTRPFQWVFEWHDTDQELRIEAGEPIQYVRLHAPDPDARFALVPLADSPELRQAIVRCAKLAPFQRNALARIDDAYARRPANLVGGGQ